MQKSARLLLSIVLGSTLTACSEEKPVQTMAEQQVAGAPPQPVIKDLRADSGKKTDPAPSDDPAAASSGSRELEWDALIPDDYRPDKLMEEFAIEDLSDDDPRAAEFMEKLEALLDEAPVREDLDGALVRLPGFVVPVEADEKETTGFLLVPYYGACIHVPPPPANQTVYVLTEPGKGAKPDLFDVIWVTGTMSVNRIDNDIAEAGYTLYASDIAPYE